MWSMPKFAVISPTHISGKKKEAWENFREGKYISFGSVCNVDLSKKTKEEIEGIVKSIPRYKKGEVKKKINEYLDFMSLEIGDYVAVRNTNDGLFGVGIITSGYYFKEHYHDTGSVDRNDFYSHFYNVDWLATQYLKRKDIMQPGEKGWTPYGIIKVYNEVPEYIKRILDGKIILVSRQDLNKSKKETKFSSPIKHEEPAWLKSLINDINQLRKDKEHKERAHESLVEAFFELLCYAKYTDIRHRQGRIDIGIMKDDKLVMVNEVKKDWHLSRYDRKVLSQAYNYAHETEAFYVIITNGDYYAIFDRRKGFSYESNFIGDFCLTKLKKEDLGLIDSMKKAKIINE